MKFLKLLLPLLLVVLFASPALCGETGGPPAPTTPPELRADSPDDSLLTTAILTLIDLTLKR
jgi:hypothetical protein